jgi:hypothetical protein
MAQNPCASQGNGAGQQTLHCGEFDNRASAGHSQEQLGGDLTSDEISVIRGD